jgi:ATP-dependent helicase Lhr and Lhr-like helicase
VTLVPTNTLELVEAVAARRAALAGQVESRHTPEAPLDVLVQHLVSIALGGGFDADALYAEVRSTAAFRELTREAFDWALAFCAHGGSSLGAYPEYHRIAAEHGLWRVSNRDVARRHRLQVGTIVGDANLPVKWLSGGTIGTIEEGFIARLNPGDHFVFAGRVLEFVRVREMAAWVRRATRAKGVVPSWGGSRMPFSTEMAEAVREVLDGAAQGDLFDPELQAARPMLEAQQRLSKLPRRGRLLVECWRSREGHHLFLYPYAGRNVHIGLAQLFAWRLTRDHPNTCSLAFNDHGLEIVGATPLVLDALHDGRLFSDRDLLPDVMASLNAGNLAQKRFREIARVSGLVFGGYPGAPKSLRQIQASSGLFYEVFRTYDAGNRLLGQAEAEVLAQELELSRLRATLRRLSRAALDVVELASPSPFALPLMVERLREQLSTEKLKDRLARLVAESEAAIERSAPR